MSRWFHCTFNMTSRKISVLFTNCGIALVAVNPGILVIFGRVFVSLFFFHDVTHILPRLTARLQREC